MPDVYSSSFPTNPSSLPQETYFSPITSNHSTNPDTLNPDSADSIPTSSEIIPSVLPTRHSTRLSKLPSYLHDYVHSYTPHCHSAICDTTITSLCVSTIQSPIKSICCNITSLPSLSLPSAEPSSYEIDSQYPEWQ